MSHRGVHLSKFQTVAKRLSRTVPHRRWNGPRGCASDRTLRPVATVRSWTSLSSRAAVFSRLHAGTGSGSGTRLIEGTAERGRGSLSVRPRHVRISVWHIPGAIDLRSTKRQCIASLAVELSCQLKVCVRVCNKMYAFLLVHMCMHV